MANLKNFAKTLKTVLNNSNKYTNPNTMFDVNYLAILVATLGAWVFGALYYSPLMLGKAWMKEMGVTDADAEKMKAKGVAKTYFLGFLSMLVTAFFLYHFVEAGISILESKSPITDAILTSLLVWFGFVVTMLFGQVQWEDKSYKLFLINALYQGIGFLIMGAILGAWM